MTHSIVKRFALAVGAGAIALATPIAAFALGYAPANRPTYTWTGETTKGADHVVFNSFVNTPNAGDERAFLDAKDAASTTSGGYLDTVPVTSGQEVLVRTYVHNNADASLNASGVGVAKNTRVRIQLPTATGNSLGLVSYISADNANNQVTDANGAVNVISDTVNFQNSSAPFSVSYVPGSAKIYNEAHAAGMTLSDAVVGTTGTQIGYENMDGNVPGCFPYVSLVTIKVKINTANLTLNKQVTIPGSAEWQKSVKSNPGDTLSWLLTVANTSTTTGIKNVAVKDQMPAHLALVPGSVTYFDSNYPEGKVMSDTALFNEGLKLPDLAASTTVRVRFRTTIKDDFKVTDCDPTVKNIATAVAEGKSPIFSDASVIVHHVCTTPTPSTTPAPTVTPTPTPTPLPDTGPVGAIGGALGITGLGYAASAYVRSRQSLKSMLRKK